jgi:hypothetical protein
MNSIFSLSRMARVFSRFASIFSPLITANRQEKRVEIKFDIKIPSSLKGTEA